MAKHTRESATRFWVRVGSRPILGVGTLLTLAGVGLLVAGGIGGVWYLVVADLLDDPSAALWSALAGGTAVFFAVVVGGRAALRGGAASTDTARRRREPSSRSGRHR